MQNETITHDTYGIGTILKVKNLTEGKYNGETMYYVQFENITCWI